MAIRPPLVVGPDGRPEALQAGDVAGDLVLSSATVADDSIARYDGTTGKLIQGSSIAVLDAAILRWLSSGGAIACGAGVDDTVNFQAADTGSASYIDFAQLKSGPTPHFNLRTNTAFVDTSDPTKASKFDCSVIASGTTRTFTFPDASGTLALTSSAGSSVALFDHFADVGNVGAGDDDLYSDTLAANTLTANGDKIHAEYNGVFNVSGCTLKCSFAGTQIFTSGSVSTSGTTAWRLSVTLIRSGTSTARAEAVLTANGVAVGTVYTALTSQDFTTTNILKITGAGGIIPADNDIVAKFSYVEKLKAA